MVKSGNTTTEFWAGLIVSLVVAVNAVLPEANQLVAIDDATALKIVGGIWSIYTVGRSWVKGAASKA